MPRDQRIREMFPHSLFLRADAGFKLRLQPKQVAHPLFKDLLSPACSKKPCMRKAKKNVPFPKRKQGIGVENDNEAISNVLQAASNS